MGRLEQLTNQNFRYTFGSTPFMEIDSLEPGLYNWIEDKWNTLVLQVDRWGGVRLADQTPTNNSNRLAKEITYERLRSRRRAVAPG
jgi:hypothetical protein